MTHIMLDLETWGKRSGCDIRSIGAVVFDPVAGIVGNRHFGISPEYSFYVATDNPEKQIAGFDDGTGTRRQYPLTRDPETVQWWNEQSEEARAAFSNPVDLREACERFTQWFSSTMLSNPYKEIRFWSNGPHFDIAILEAVYHAVNLPVPWHYRAPRDFRTIVEAAGMDRNEFCTYGDAHNALHDAIAQAMTVCEAYKRLGLQRTSFDECAATGRSCEYAPDGPNNEMQCRYCGKPIL